MKEIETSTSSAKSVPVMSGTVQDGIGNGIQQLSQLDIVAAGLLLEESKAHERRSSIPAPVNVNFVNNTVTGVESHNRRVLKQQGFDVETHISSRSEMRVTSARRSYHARKRELDRDEHKKRKKDEKYEKHHERKRKEERREKRYRDEKYDKRKNDERHDRKRRDEKHLKSKDNHSDTEIVDSKNKKDNKKIKKRLSFLPGIDCPSVIGTISPPRYPQPKVYLYI
eukprot:GHVL01004082.1.p1 GENE.GHVL01004082.1~~GHVL01004082.1.p1  ORF type:complete len:234 (-),score=54.67 GHVL01004082.1:151-825(-)